MFVYTKGAILLKITKRGAILNKWVQYLGAEGASPGVVEAEETKRRSSEASLFSSGCKVRSSGVARSSSIEDETFGGLWSMGTGEKESEGKEVSGLSLVAKGKPRQNRKEVFDGARKR
uniref:Uncharacterized protein n=1 Tax=Lactuca sativa TaxID=4236 RepID=A0A9R1X1J4_LACSA|nr:hypothetical protein LSAT_V11C700385400 [Lactuca sativa]